MNNIRRMGLDIIRACAVIFVLSVHFFLNTNFYSEPMVGKSMCFQLMLRMIFIICVPLFILLSGYLLNNRKPTKDYYVKVLNILYVYFIYSLMAVLTRMFILKENKRIKEYLVGILDFSTLGYSWYINMYIGLFLIIPFLNLIYNNLKTKNEKKLLLVIFIFITAVPSFFNGKFRGMLNFPNYWVDIYPITYYFIGSYIREYKPKINKVYGIISFFLIIFLEMIIELYYANGGIFQSKVGYYPSLIITVEAVMFFLLLYDIDVKSKFIIKIVSTISILSLDIYLVSYSTDKIVYKLLYKYFPLSQNKIILLFIPSVFITFTLAFSISFVRNKLIKIKNS